jgi:hypothetical protein
MLRGATGSVVARQEVAEIREFLSQFIRGKASNEP